MVGVSSLWSKGRKAKQVDPPFTRSLAHKGRASLPFPQVAERCVMLMLNEAVRCVDEVIRSVRDEILVRYLALVSAISQWTVPLYRSQARAKWLQ